MKNEWQLPCFLRLSDKDLSAQEIPFILHSYDWEERPGVTEEGRMSEREAGGSWWSLRCFYETVRPAGEAVRHGQRKVIWWSWSIEARFLRAQTMRPAVTLRTHHLWPVPLLRASRSNRWFHRGHVAPSSLSWRETLGPQFPLYIRP